MMDTAGAAGSGMTRKGGIVMKNGSEQSSSQLCTRGRYVCHVLLGLTLAIALALGTNDAKAQNDPAIISKTFEVAGEFGPQRGYGPSENGNLNIPIDTIVGGPAFFTTQAPLTGAPDEGFGLGVKWLPSVENTPTGFLHRSANQVETLFQTDGTSKDFKRGDLRQLRRVVDATSPNGGFKLTYLDGSIEIYNQSTSKGFFLTSSVDPYGNTTTFSYSANSPIPNSIVLPGDMGTIKIENDGKRVSKMTSPDNVAVSFNYTNNRISEVTGPDGSVVLGMKYDKVGLGLPTSVKDAAGNETLVAYKIKPGTKGPAAVAVISTPDGEQYTFEHSKNSATMTSSKGFSTKVTLAKSPGSGDVYAAKVLQGGRLVSAVTVNNDGNVIETIDAKGLSTKYSYAANGAIGSSDTTSPLITGAQFPDGSKVVALLDSKNAFRPTKVIETSSSNISKEQIYSWNGPQLLATAVKARGQQVSQITYKYEGNNPFPSSSETTATQQATLSSSGVPVSALTAHGDVLSFQNSPTTKSTSVNGTTFQTTLSVAPDSSVSVTSSSPFSQITRTNRMSGRSGSVTLRSASSQGMTLDLTRSSATTLSDTGGSSTTHSCDSVANTCKTTRTCVPNPNGGCDLVTTTECSNKQCTPSCEGKLCGADDGCGNTCNCDFRNLSVEKDGNGSGTVTSDPTGIDCGNVCSQSYKSGTKITLTAKPADGSVFAGWSAPCKGFGTCSVTLTDDTKVTATFNKQLVKYDLTVSKGGTGSGTVTSDPAGISCGSTCKQSYNSGTKITLTATPDSTSVFAGWSGACNGTATSCTVTISAATNVTANFNKKPPVTYDLTVSKAGTGSGAVTSSPAGINCGSTCRQSYNSGAQVTLTAAADTGSVFAGWSGACSGTVTTCTVTVSAATNVTATFNKQSTEYPLKVNKSGNGSGTVSSNPTGIDCGNTCGHPYGSGTQVTLTATPNTGSVFAGWSGDCSGTGACSVTISSAKNVTAQFNAISQCVPDGSNGAGSCCNGHPRCPPDNVCRPSCGTLTCMGKTCSSNNDCCSAYPVCSKGTCSMIGMPPGGVR